MNKTLLIVVAGLALAAVVAIVMVGGGAPDPTPPPSGMLERTVDAMPEPVVPVSDPVSPVRDRGTRRAASGATADGPGKETGGGLRGRVVDRGGNPMEGVAMRLIQGSASPVAALLLRERPTILAETKTGPDGSYQFARLAMGAIYDVEATAGAHAPATLPGYAVRRAGFIDLPDIRLTEGFFLVGRVIDERGGGVEGAALELQSTMAFQMLGGSQARTPLTATTGGDGRYELKAVPAGSHAVSVTAPGYATAVIQNILFEGESGRVTRDFRLGRSFPIAGKVTDKRGEAVSGAAVEAFMHASQQGSKGTGSSNEAGEFLVEGLAAGTYSLMVRAPGFSPGNLPRVDTGNTNVLIELDRQGSISGTVAASKDEHPIARFHLALKRIAPGQVLSSPTNINKAFKSADGSFLLGGMEPARYTVLATANGYAPTYSDPFDLRRGEQKEGMVLRMLVGGRITGRIVSAKDGSPVRRATVTTRDKDYQDNPIVHLFGGMLPSRVGGHSVQTDADGTFSFEHLTPGVYRLEVAHSRYTTLLSETVEVADAETRDMGTQLRLQVGAVLTGIVYRSGTAMPGAKVTVQGMSEKNRVTKSVTADGNGRYTAGNLPAGQYELSATRPSTQNQNPFAAIADIQNSKTGVFVGTGEEKNQDIRIP